MHRVLVVATINMTSPLFASKLTTVNLAIFAAPVPLVSVYAFQSAPTCPPALHKLVGIIALILLVLIVLHVHLDITLIPHMCLPQIRLVVETNANVGYVHHLWKQIAILPMANIMILSIVFADNVQLIVRITMEMALLEFMFIQRLLMDLNHVHVNCVHLLSLLSTALIIALIVAK
jgi:hypothetical protein